MDRRYAEIDLHRRRSVFFPMDAEGEKLFCERIGNDALRLLEAVSAAGELALATRLCPRSATISTIRYALVRPQPT
jgi:hypothetical protein